MDVIDTPETKPATEIIFGRPLQKMSPRWRHARIQAMLGGLLTQWARGRGRVGSEWDCYPAPPGEPHRKLVPDLSYFSYTRLPRDVGRGADAPLFAPDVAIEIISPSERPSVIVHKAGVYLRSGGLLVVLIEADARTITACDANGTVAFVDGMTFSHPALPDFALDVAPFFDEVCAD